MTAGVLLDNSAWVRLGDPAVPQTRADEIAGLIESDDIATCLPFLLEAGYSARSGSDHKLLFEQLRALPMIHIDERIEARALDAQRQLARAGHHRLPPVDLIVASCADVHGIGVLHYDHDYDLILDKTDLQYESIWLAPRGSL